jgi:hypothetical protein
MLGLRWFGAGQRLSLAQRRILQALAAGDQLKAHRTMDGVKVYFLHPLREATPQEVDGRLVVALEQQGLIESNLKFPASVFLLTEKGAALVATADRPVGPRRFSPPGHEWPG